MTDYYRELDHSVWDHERDGWRSLLVQSLRFEVVIRGLEIGAEESVIDLGCGGGGLLRHLGQQRRGTYLGVDLRQRAIERSRSLSRGTFRCLDIWSEEVDEAGPFDIAVAIGTLVDGKSSVEKGGRLAELQRLISRLEKLGQRGWALVVLDQDRLEEDLLRSLEKSLMGARREEVESLCQGGQKARWFEDGIFPEEFVIFSDRSFESGQRRIWSQEEAFAAVLKRHEPTPCEEARFWLALQRPGQARRVLEGAGGDEEVQLLRAKCDLLAQK